MPVMDQSFRKSESEIEQRHKKEFKKSLREQLKDCAMMRYKKNIKDFSKDEMKLCLESILKINYGFYKLSIPGMLEDYKNLFRETFSKELKYIDKNVKR